MRSESNIVVTDLDPVQSETNSPSRDSAKVGWLVEPQRRRPLLPASGLWIVVLDWLLLSSNLLSLGLATPIVMCLGLFFGSVGTFYIQSRFASDKLWLAAVKALFAGVVVGVPWPLTGTLIGGWVLFVSGLAKRKRHSGEPRT
jgi:hypothetical protein